MENQLLVSDMVKKKHEKTTFLPQQTIASSRDERNPWQTESLLKVDIGDSKIYQLEKNGKNIILPPSLSAL